MFSMYFVHYKTGLIFQGSYRCGKCNDGFLGDGYRGCRAGNYCVDGLNNCGDNSVCIPLGAGKFNCRVS